MVTRPALRYHGGKWQLAPWIIEHMPPHRVYTESFGGGASVLLRKPRSYAEVYNDLDGEIVNLFRVLRNPAQARELIRLVALTPHAREEYELSYLTDGDPIEQARRTLARSYMSHGPRSMNGDTTGYRIIGASRNNAADWQHVPDTLRSIVDRFTGVSVENRPACEVLKTYDGPDTLHYVDPPYVLDTRYERGATSVYAHEMTDADHVDLANVLRSLKGGVIVSGYACALYDELFAGWHTVERGAHADGTQKRTEVLWISPNAVRQPTLFGAHLA